MLNNYLLQFENRYKNDAILIEGLKMCLEVNFDARQNPLNIREKLEQMKTEFLEISKQKILQENDFDIAVEKQGTNSDGEDERSHSLEFVY